MKRRAFIPRFVLGTSVATAIPACVLGGCGDGGTSPEYIFAGDVSQNHDLSSETYVPDTRNDLAMHESATDEGADALSDRPDVLNDGADAGVAADAPDGATD